MKSRFAQKFNHDEDADTYDTDVLDTSHPFREGYESCLDWVARQANIDPACRVLDLGSGTGNLADRLPPCKRLVCVDVSNEMMNRAAQKLRHREEVDLVIADLLGYFDAPREFDRIVSTYAIHHLTEEEKAVVFKKIHASLTKNGRMVIGDLMFENGEARADLRARLSAELVAELEDEFFWNIEQSIPILQELGFKTGIRSFSPFSWGIAATK